MKQKPSKWKKPIYTRKLGKTEGPLLPYVERALADHLPHGPSVSTTLGSRTKGTPEVENTEI